MPVTPTGPWKEMPVDAPQALDTPAPDAELTAQVPAPGEDGDLVEDDLLVEDVSIDGMCGVY